jgi:AraC-like DNA-binding protein
VVAARPIEPPTRGWYIPVFPPADLSPVLVCSWTAVPTGRHRLVPDGCVDIVCLSSGRIMLCGPETTAWTFELPVGTTAVGARFRPGGASHIFGLDLSTVRNQVVPFGKVVGDEAADHLARTLGQRADLESRRSALERWLACRITERKPRTDEFADAVLLQLVTSPRATPGELGAPFGLTTRQVHRRSLQLFGYGSSVLARLIRFQRFLSLSEAAGSSARLGLLAVEAGFADQAHLIRDCRAITGLSPLAFLADYFPTFPDMSDPYKTGSPGPGTLRR